MSWTKGKLVLQAFSAIGLPSYVYDVKPEQLQDAGSVLDSMMAGWDALGIKLSYPLSSTPDNVDLDQQSNVPARSVEAVYLNLAVKICPMFGKTPSPELKASALKAYDMLLIQAAQPMQSQLPADFPAGAGNKPWRIYDDPFLPPPVDPLEVGGDGPLEL